MKKNVIMSTIYHAAVHGNIRIMLVGAGGTGSHLLHRLGAINQQLELITGKQLLVTVCDFDIVEPHNCGRQLFDREYDIGLNKAKCLVETVNRIYGTSFVAIPSRADYDAYLKVGPQLVVMAVDSISSRKEVLKFVNKICSVIDIGNGDSFGQVLLQGGESSSSRRNPRYSYVDGINLSEYFGGMAEPKKKKSSGCSAVDSLMEQNVLINASMAMAAANLINRMLYANEIDVEAIYVNNESLEVVPKLA